MSAENCQRLRSAYETLSRTGARDSPELVAEDFELRQDPMLYTGRTFHGPNGPGEMLTRLAGSFLDVVVEAERFAREWPR